MCNDRVMIASARIRFCKNDCINDCRSAAALLEEFVLKGNQVLLCRSIVMCITESQSQSHHSAAQSHYGGNRSSASGAICPSISVTVTPFAILKSITTIHIHGLKIQSHVPQYSSRGAL